MSLHGHKAMELDLGGGVLLCVCFLRSTDTLTGCLVSLGVMPCKMPTLS